MDKRADDLFIQRSSTTVGKAAINIDESPIEPIGHGIEAIIFDGDDTLWQTQVIYDEAKEKFYRLIEEQGFGQLTSEQGFNKQALATKLAEIDVANVARYGFTKIRFAKSMRDVYKYFCAQCARPIDSRTLRRISRIGYSVFDRRPMLTNGTKSILAYLHPRYRLYLYTAGNRGVQEEKIKELGISVYFEEIYILDQKSETKLQRILLEQRLEASRTLMVGNSVRSDINPALRVGLPCIWLRSHSWEDDKAELLSDQVWQVDTLRDILPIIKHSLVFV